MIALILVTAWVVRFPPRGARKIAGAGGLLALLLAGLLWTHSRSSYLALSLGLLVFAARPG